MEIAITTSHQAGYLLATAQGRFALEPAKRHFLALLEVIVRENAERVLVDAREVTGKLRVLERFLYGEFAAHAVARLTELVAIRPPKFAYVAAHPILDPGRLGENVARERGMNVRAFDSMEEALDWLLAES
ncbi:MAG: hypothetical protein ACREMA_01805 [Longimicrobiales bacterium]